MADAGRASDVDSFQAGQHAANAYVLILAGHETTSSALAYTSYLLALHPEVQERLAEEIDNYLQEHPVSEMYCAISIVGIDCRLDLVRVMVAFVPKS